MNVRLKQSIVLLLLIGSIVWAYWTTIGEMAERWSDDPQYSHGYLVPLFAAFLLWFRRREADVANWSPSWWGVLLLAAGVGAWMAGTHFYVGWIAAISLLISVAGAFLTIGGWPALRWALPAVLFLGFMVPLPYRLQNALGGGLQRIAAASSTYALQTFGAPALREGNVILIGEVKIGVVEACSGLGMMMTFFALSAAVALLLRTAEPWLRLTLLASAVPVAIIANVIRITVTGLLYHSSNDGLARAVFHDVGGWLMMPLAIALLLLELHVLRRVIVTEPDRAVPDAPVFGLPRLSSKASKPGRGAEAAKRRATVAM